MTHAHESDALTSLMVASAGHDSPTASSEASRIILSGMCDVKQSDVSCDGLLQPQARVCAQPQGPDQDHTKHIGQTTASNALFFYQLAVGADMSHGFFHDKVLNIQSSQHRKNDTHNQIDDDPACEYFCYDHDDHSSNDKTNGVNFGDNTRQQHDMRDSNA